MNRARILFLLICMATVVGIFLYNSELVSSQYINHSAEHFRSFREQKLPLPPRNFHFQSPKQKEENIPSRTWQKVGTSKKAYVFSAYYKAFEHIVEMIAIVERTKVASKFSCVFSGTKKRETFLMNAALQFVDTPLPGTSFHTVFIRCSIPVLILPTQVKLQFDEHSSKLNIIYNSQDLYNISVCLPSFFDNFSDYMRVIETIETSILFGAQFFTVYNHSIGHDVDKVFRHYVDRGLMEVIGWNKPETNIHHDGQWAHLQDCHLANRYKSKYVVIHDVDELIVPHKHGNWLEMLMELDKNNTQPHGSYMFLNSFFDMKHKDQGSVKVNQLKIRSLQYVWRENRFWPPRIRCKAIHVPTRVVTAGIHYTMKLEPGFVEKVVDPSVAFVHHYRIGRDEVQNSVKDEFMKKFTSNLILKISNTLSNLGFLR